ncbi:hypothetical protein IHV25_07710 [Phaeovibrio sulfidiphilus]|uniref:Uncharacterized protein n=1 Tax=Phaeovibrio sulfidiphilus TaxID=1220600 RepID=A0A8J7CD75_9PROT|nr:hypothetical protein [Phaeovibrio sulfidiphilus]MBE1237533.1 hypothetical protein [Phaeovibrio sulfidiphilus]
MARRRKETPGGLLTAVVLALAGTVTAGWLVLVPVTLYAISDGYLGADFLVKASLITLIPLLLLWLGVLCGFVVWNLVSMRRQFATLAHLSTRTLEDTEALGRVILRSQQESQRRAERDVVDLIIKDMNAQLAVIMERIGMVGQGEMETLWGMTAAGNPWAIPATFMASAELTGQGFRTIVSDRLIADPQSTVALQSFLTRYEQMMRLLDTYDENRLLKEIIGESPYERVIFLLTNILHLLHTRMKERQSAQGLAPVEGVPAVDPAAGPDSPQGPLASRVPLARSEAVS